MPLSTKHKRFPRTLARMYERRVGDFPFWSAAPGPAGEKDSPRPRFERGTALSVPQKSFVITSPPWRTRDLLFMVVIPSGGAPRQRERQSRGSPTQRATRATDSYQ